MSHLPAPRGRCKRLLVRRALRQRAKCDEYSPFSVGGDAPAAHDGEQERQELGHILSSMEALSPTVARIGAARERETLTELLMTCHPDGGSMALWCNLAGGMRRFAL